MRNDVGGSGMGKDLTTRLLRCGVCCWSGGRIDDKKTAQTFPSLRLKWDEGALLIPQWMNRLKCFDDSLIRIRYHAALTYETN